jgi:ATP-binding cassette subfamily B protein
MKRDDETLGNALDRHLLRRIFGFVRPYPGLLAGALLLLPVVMVFDLLQPKILQLAIDHAIARRDLSSLPMLSLAFLGALAGQSIAGYFQTYCLQLLGPRATTDLRLSVYRHLLSLRMAFFDRTPVGKLMTRVSSDVEAINEAFAGGLVTIVADLVRLAAILVILFKMDFALTLVSLASAPILFLIAALARRYVRDAFRELRSRLAELNAFLQEHLSGMKIVQLFCRERQVAERFEERNRGYRDANYRAIRADATLFAIVEMVGMFAMAALLAGGAARIAAGTLTIGVLVAFLQYLDRFFTPIRDLSAKYTIMQSAMAAAERIFALLDNKELDAEPRAAEGAHAKTDSAIELDHVSFGYRADQPILNDLTLRVRPGEIVAIVGSTGAGKSTLIKLLTRLYEVSQGRILLSGTDARTIDRRALRQRVAVVAQDPFRQPTTNCVTPCNASAPGESSPIGPAISSSPSPSAAPISPLEKNSSSPSPAPSCAIPRC